MADSVNLLGVISGTLPTLSISFAEVQLEKFATAFPLNDLYQQFWQILPVVNWQIWKKLVLSDD